METHNEISAETHRLEQDHRLLAGSGAADSLGLQEDGYRFGAELVPSDEPGTSYTVNLTAEKPTTDPENPERHEKPVGHHNGWVFVPDSKSSALAQRAHLIAVRNSPENPDQDRNRSAPAARPNWLDFAGRVIRTVYRDLRNPIDPITRA